MMNRLTSILRRPWGAVLAATSFVLVVTGCTVFEPERRPVCPNISSLPNAGSITLFKPGPGRDLIDIEQVGEVVWLKLSCGDPEPDGMAAVAQIDLVLRRGPSSNPDQAKKVEVPFFVSVVDRTGAIQDQAVFRSTIVFRQGEQVAGVREEIDVRISTSRGQSLVDTGVMVGFQLTPEQYDFNLQQARQ